MPTSVSDLIHSSFRLIGAIAAGETLETSELNDAFASLNQMLAVWNTEGASLFGRQRNVFQIGGSNGPYGLSFRPVRIESASVAAGGIDSPLEIVDSVGWERTPEKQAQTVFVQKLFCDYAYPNSSIYIAPIPRLPGTLEMWSYIPLQQFGAVSQNIDLPPGYEMALRYNFAVALLPEYPRSAADPSLPAQAQMYKASIAQLNALNHIHAAAAPAGVPAQ